MNYYNERLKYYNYIYDMNIEPIISNNYLKNLLEVNNKEYYYNHKLIDNKTIENILNNRNINYCYKIKKAVVLNRTYGKLLPSDIILYSNIKDNYFNRNQLIEINIGTPIYIIHISKDKLWYFIKTYNYYCWVKKDDICIVNDNIFNKYLNPKRFIVITNKLYIEKNKFIDIGVKLPLYKKINNNYKVIIPNIYNNIYKDKIININSKYLNEGYVKYNYHNLIVQSLKYLNTPYGWGGMNNGIDCSGFISNIYKVFGILLPRDTSKQQQIVGTTIIDMKQLNFIEKYKQLIKIKKTCIIYFKSHVMLLLGIKNKNIYVIHASSNYKKVIITKLDNKTIDNITSLHIIEF